MKEKLITGLEKKIGALRLRPKDIVIDSGGLLSHSEASRLLSLKTSKAGLLYLQGLCEKLDKMWREWQKGTPIAGKYTEMIVRAYRTVELNGGVYIMGHDPYDDKGGSSGPVFKKVPDPGNPIKTNIEVIAPLRPREAYDPEFFRRHIPDPKSFENEYLDKPDTSKKSVRLEYSSRDTDNVMGMKRNQKGKLMFFGDGDDVYFCNIALLQDATHVILGETEYDINNFLWKN